MISKQLQNRIKKLYLSDKNVHMLSGIQTFRKSLKDDYGISVSLKDLELTLKELKVYQLFKERKIKGKFNARSVKLLECQGEIACMIQGICGGIFKIIWSILRSDAGLEYRSKRTRDYLSSRSIFLSIKRGGSGQLSIVERFVAFIKNLIWKRLKVEKLPDNMWPKVIAKCFKVYNLRKHGVTKESPDLVTEMQDPEIRQRLLENAKHHDKVHREDFVKSWKRMKRALALFDKPHNNKREILQEKPNDFRKDQMVYVDYKTIVKKGDLALRRAFRAKRGNKYIFKIAEVNVLQKPYMYKLKQIKGGQLIPGLFYGFNLHAYFDNDT